MLKRIKSLKSHNAHARFLAECEFPDGLWIPMQKDIPSPYAYSQEWVVHEWLGKYIIVRETAHRQFDVFEVPEMMVRSDDPLVSEANSNYLANIGV